MAGSRLGASHFVSYQLIYDSSSWYCLICSAYVKDWCAKNCSYIYLHESQIVKYATYKTQNQNLLKWSILSILAASYI